MKSFSIHTTVRIRPGPKNKPAFAPVRPRPRDIREYRKGFSRPIVCRNRSDTGHTPRKLPRFHEQSPASSHNTPVLSHTRLISIAVTRLYVNSFFGIITEKFALFLCRAMIFYPAFIFSLLQPVGKPFAAAEFLLSPVQNRQGLSTGAHRSQYHSSCMRIPWENSRIADDFEWSLVHEPQILHLPQFGLFAISIISDEIYSALFSRARAVSTLSSNAA